MVQFLTAEIKILHFEGQFDPKDLGQINQFSKSYETF